MSIRNGRGRRSTNWRGCTAAAGFDPARAADRLSVLLREPWLDPRVLRTCRPGRPGPGSPRRGAMPRGLPWQEPDRGWGDRPAGPTCTPGSTPPAAPADRRRLRRGLRRLGRSGARIVPAARLTRAGTPAAPQPRPGPTSPPRCARPSGTRPALTDAQALALLHADGAELDALAALADDLRRDTAGDDVTYVVTRNINFTNVCYTGCRFCAFAQRSTDADAYTLSLDQIGDRAEEAWAAGPPRCACRAASTRTCPARPTSTSRPRSSGAARICTCTRSRRWRSSTARPAPGCRCGSG